MKASKSKAPQPRWQLHVRADVGARYVPFIRRHLRAAHSLLDTSLAELSIALVNDATMAELHQKFLGIAGPTDVLTFELDEDLQGRVMSGEVVVCVPEARRQAQLRQICVERELLLYALHGTLHLSGFDDRTEKGYRAMHAAEDDILIRLGVGPVFDATSSQSPVSAGVR